MNVARALRRFLRLPVWTLLLLATIGLQAAGPVAPPYERTEGSAFNATTVDVALAPARLVASAAGLPQAPPPASTPLLPGRPVALAPAEAPHLRPAPRGPPPRDHPSRAPDSTAPPFA